MAHKSKKKLSPDEALHKMRKYCAYQERCHHDARYKLVKMGVYGDLLEAILGQLIEDKFLDEERFARAFARGKFRNNQWGWIKIRLELKRRKINDYLITKAREEITDDEYRDVLHALLTKKKDQLSPGTGLELHNKLFRFAQQKGFETWIISDILAQHF